MQRAACAGPTANGGGGAARQASTPSRSGRRTGSPRGMSTSSGTRPGIVAQPLRRARRAEARPRAEQAARVGVRQALEHLAGRPALDDACRRTSPARARRVRAITPRSWLISSSAMPLSATSSAIRSRISRLDRHVERGGRLVGDQQVGAAGERHRRSSRAGAGRPRAGADRRRAAAPPAAGARARAAAAPRRAPRARAMPRCRRSGSATCSPTVCSGFSAVIGSWNTIADAVAAQRAQSRVGQARPARGRRSGCCRSPARLRAAAPSARARSSTCRSRSRRSGRRVSPRCSCEVDAAQRLGRGRARSASVDAQADSIGQQGSAAHQRASPAAGSSRSRRPSPIRLSPSTRARSPGPARPRAAAPGTACVCASLSMRPQRRLRRLRAEAEVAERRLGEDRDRELDRRLHDQRAGDVRQHVLEA